MIHEKYVIRGPRTHSLREKAHIFQRNPPKMWVSAGSICGLSGSFMKESEPGDGRPSCKTCARIAKKRGWLG